MNRNSDLDPETLVREVLAADDRRRAANVAGDAATLEPLLTADFTYTHSNGFREGREPYLARIRTAQVDYLEMTRVSADVRLYGNIALIDGLARMTYRLASRSAPNTLETLYLAVWTNHGEGWQLTAYASTEYAST